MKIFFPFLTVFLIAGAAYGVGYDLNVPVPGDSVANDELQYIVVKDLYNRTMPKYPACRDFSVYDTKVTKFPYDLKKKDDAYIQGFWSELWTINACGNKTQFPIDFSIGKKTVNYSVYTVFD